jgi:hypothetical protein
MIGTILSIIGVLITIGFGVYSVWTYKKSKKIVSLEFKNKECYSLFKDDVSRLNIELSYNSKPISNSIILFKAKIINNGQVDIDKSRIYKPLKLISDKNFNWLEARITNKPDSATASVEKLSVNELKFEWDLLKVDESIEFEALIEIENIEKGYEDNAFVFYETLGFDFRITDLKSVQKEKPKSDHYFRILMYPFIIIIIGLGIVIADIFPTINIMPKQYDIEYMIIKNNSTEKAYLLPIRGDRVMVVKKNGDESDIMPISVFNRNYKISKVEDINVSNFDALWNRITGILFVFMGILLIITRITRGVIRKNKLKKNT